MAQAYNINLDDNPSVLSRIGGTISNLLSVVDTTSSALNEVAGTAEALARTGHGMADRNERYITDKGNALHEARMIQLNQQIADMKRPASKAKTKTTAKAKAKAPQL